MAPAGDMSAGAAPIPEGSCWWAAAHHTWPGGVSLSSKIIGHLASACS